MSERESYTITKTKGKSEAQVKEEAKQLDEELLNEQELEAMYASVLERGVVVDRLEVPLPANVHGEWIRNNSIDIEGMRALGFDVDQEYAHRRAIHDTGDKTAVVGDVIFMTCTKRNKEIIDRVKENRKQAIHNPAKPREMRDYEGITNAETGGIIPTTDSSKQEAVGADDISDALNALERQQIVGG